MSLIYPMCSQRYINLVSQVHIMFPDIDECVQNPCQHGHCINTDGGFMCTCDQGYVGQLCNKSKYRIYSHIHHTTFIRINWKDRPE